MFQMTQCNLNTWRGNMVGVDITCQIFVADIRGHVETNNNIDNCHQLDIYCDNSDVLGLESFQTVYESPPKRVIRYKDQKTDVINMSARNNFNTSAPCERGGISWCSERKPSAHRNPYYATYDVPYTDQTHILQRIDTQKEREAFVVRLLRRPWTDTKMPCMPKFLSRELLRFFQKHGKVSIVFMLLWCVELNGSSALVFIVCP